MNSMSKEKCKATYTTAVCDNLLKGNFTPKKSSSFYGQLLFWDSSSSLRSSSILGLSSFLWIHLHFLDCLYFLGCLHFWACLHFFGPSSFSGSSGSPSFLGTSSFWLLFSFIEAESNWSLPPPLGFIYGWKKIKETWSWSFHLFGVVSVIFF